MARCYISQSGFWLRGFLAGGLERVQNSKMQCVAMLNYYFISFKINVLFFDKKLRSCASTIHQLALVLLSSETHSLEVMEIYGEKGQHFHDMRLPCQKFQI